MKTFFVSPVGNDKNVGTEREQAFYTLTRARRRSAGKTIG